MRQRGILFHGRVNSAEAGGHRSKPEVVLALERIVRLSVSVLRP